ncbi:hypothetical protein HY630_01935 [Candidatus Uhrbacteria bacterium]|nr:hypothetical protein [Candidatus Uhrbacteria bacterium]
MHKNPLQVLAWLIPVLLATYILVFDVDLTPSHVVPAQADTPDPKTRTVPISFPVEALNQDWEDTGWVAVDILARQKGIFQYLGIIQDSDTLEPWTDEYFRALLHRRERAREFAASHAPHITVIGQVHRLELERHTQQMGQNVDQAQAWVYHRILENRTAGSVLFVEGFPYDGVPVTLGRLDEISSTNREALIDAITVQDYETRDARIAILVLHPDLPVFGAEEWPLLGHFQALRFERDILQGVLGEKYWERNTHDHDLTRRGVAGLSDADRGRLEMSRSCESAFMRLRSELALILALEHLERTGGSHAIIVMGAMHGPQIESINTTYGADLIYLPPPEEFLRHIDE